MAGIKPMPRPIFKWVGGKSSSVDAILSAIPESFGDYHEPFFGGGSVFFALVRAGRIKGAAHLSDSNPELISTYRSIKTDPDEVIRAIRAMRPERIDEARYNEVRDCDTGALTARERAARVLFLNKTCVNGLYRVNSDGKFNVSWGKHEKWKPDFANIMAVSEALQCANLSWRDFDECTYADDFCVKKHDVVYMDPPYFPRSETANFSSYTAGGFSLADQMRVAAKFAELAKLGAHVIASNADIPVTRTVYGIIPGVRFTELQVRRNINSDGTKRGCVGELLITHEKPKRKARVGKAVDDRQVEMFGGAE